MEVKTYFNQVKMLIVSLVCISLIHCIHGLSSNFGEVHNGYLHKIVRNTKSSEMSNYLNEEAEPCTNFYDFVCGNYKRINPPNDFMVNSVFQDLSDGLHRKFLSLIKPNEAADTLTDMKVKNFYESCMNLAILRNTYRSKLREIINEFGNMPALEGDNWRDSNYFDWLGLIAEINRKYGKIIILGSDIVPDLTNHTLNSLEIRQQVIPLGSVTAYTDESQKGARNIRISNIFYNLKYMFGLGTREADQTAKEIFKFETHLFVGYNTQGINTNHTFNFGSSAVGQHESIEEMQKKYDPHIDIKRLLKLTFGYLPNKSVFDRIASSAENIINTVNGTQDRIVANYIFYSLIENFMLIRDPVARNLKNFMTLASPKRKDQLQKVCIVVTEKYFSNVLNNMVYRKYMPNETEINLSPLWQTIKLAFRGILDTNSLPEMTGIYKISVDTLQAMTLEIRSYNETHFDKEYEDLTISKHDYVENIKSILIFQALNSRAQLNISNGKFEEEDDRLSIVPFYNPLENSITVPVSLLQPYYLWSDSYPNALNYGTVGFLVARQIIHAFGKEFISYDKSGNYVQVADDYTNYFSNISQCFETQYHNYYLDGRSLPKLESQYENIADSGGVRLAYNAYMWWHSSQRNTSEEYLPHLSYTRQQLFFISFGQMFCSAGNDSTKSSNSFAVETYRVNQALSNLEDFSKAFKCSESSNMNPRTKCMIY